jgi:hypothetical protein
LEQAMSTTKPLRPISMLMMGWSSLSMKLSSMATLPPAAVGMGGGEFTRHALAEFGDEGLALGGGNGGERSPTSRIRVELRSRVSFSVRPRGRKTSTPLR